MTNRVVQWDDYIQRGGSIQFGPPFNSHFLYSDAIGNKGRIDDVVGNRAGANPFSLLRIIENYPLLNGDDGAGGQWFVKYDNCPIGASATTVEDPRTHWGTPDVVELSDFAWRILAVTNPSRPDVNVPAAIAELRDLPRLVRGWGQGYLKTAANANLSWRFGIRPMLGDIQKLLDFTEATEKRLKQLRRLRDGKTLKTRCYLGAGEEIVDHGQVLLHSHGSQIFANATTTHSYEMWGTAEWKLLDSSALPEMDDAEMRNFARRLITGITSYGALETAWELTPWSWLIDWFSNTGDLLAASNNAVGCTWGRICVMRHSRSVRTYDKGTLVKPEWVNLDGWFTVIGERKERFPTFPVIPVPLPRLPILTNGQLSILLSLAALRR